MGSWKPLLPFGGSTLIETVVAAALEACPRVLLVTGRRGADLAARFVGEPRVIIVENEGWERGMFSSIQLGAAQTATARFFVTLGDMPWIGPHAYEKLLEGNDGAEVVFPAFGGRRGHPVLVHERMKSAVAAADPLRGSMRRIAESFRVREVPWPDDTVLRDVDSPDDLR
jgi:molybdenum cofactor cytidylyltransferase